MVPLIFESSSCWRGSRRWALPKAGSARMAMLLSRSIVTILQNDWGMPDTITQRMLMWLYYLNVLNNYIYPWLMSCDTLQVALPTPPQMLLHRIREPLASFSVYERDSNVKEDPCPCMRQAECHMMCSPSELAAYLGARSLLVVHPNATIISMIRSVNMVIYSGL